MRVLLRTSSYPRLFPQTCCKYKKMWGLCRNHPYLWSSFWLHLVEVAEHTCLQPLVSLFAIDSYTISWNECVIFLCNYTIAHFLSGAALNNTWVMERYNQNWWHRHVCWCCANLRFSFSKINLAHLKPINPAAASNERPLANKASEC